MKNKWMIQCMLVLVACTFFINSKSEVKADIDYALAEMIDYNVDSNDEDENSDSDLMTHENQDNNQDYANEDSNNQDNTNENNSNLDNPNDDNNKEDISGEDSEDEDHVPEVPEENGYEKDARNWSQAYLSKTYITRGKTSTYQLHLRKIPNETSSYSVTWKSSNKKIATVDTKGNVTAKKKGVATITCTVRTEAGFETSFTCEFTVSNPRFRKEVYAVAKSSKLQLGIKGTNTTNMKIAGSDDTLLKVYQSNKGLVKGKRIGTVTVTAVIDGVSIQCKVIVTNPKLKKSLYVMTAKEVSQIQVYNQSGIKKVTYESKNPRIATVTKKGVITAKKVGVAVILVTVDEKVFEVTVSVGSAKAVAAIKYAQRALGSTYSQAYRMRKGYYDCSSLVWRSYMPTGFTFGYSKYASNAPTAAGEAYYLVKNKKEIARSYVDESSLKPGDVVFISSKYNGRFRNITHVVIYIGNDLIIHATPANGNCVQYGSYKKYKNTIVSIGRPIM